MSSSATPNGILILKMEPLPGVLFSSIWPSIKSINRPVIARQRSDATIICGLLGAQDNLPRDFGVVTLWDVIEHVPDPEQLLSDCAAHLAAGGTLMLETPDEGALLRRVIRVVGRLTSGLSRDLRENIYYRAHRFYFSRRSMLQLLQRCGFDQVSFYSWHTMFRKELLKKKLNRSVPGWKRLLLRAIFGVLRYLPFSGNKMIAIARKVPPA